jgi:hypothetical protein
MPRDSDGNPQGSFGRAKFHDEATAGRKKEKAQPSPEMSKAGKTPEDKVVARDVEDLVDKHGPANQTDHHHDGAGGYSTVSHHGDQQHEAVHDNLHSAHLHGHIAMGSPHPEPSSHPIEDHVEEHGPAHHVVHHHDEETGKHHVTSHHGEDDEAHHSVHDSHEEAHAHMGKAMGIGSTEDNETKPYGGKETLEEEVMEARNPSIPGMTS